MILVFTNSPNISRLKDDSGGIITSAKEVMYSFLFVCWLVCKQDYIKTVEWVSAKLGWRMGLTPE